jgi:hypothetical protein
LFEIKALFETVYEKLEKALAECNLKPVGENLPKKGVPIFEKDGTERLCFESETGGVLIYYDDSRKVFTLEIAHSDGIGELSYSVAAEWLFDTEKNDERDAKSIANDFDDTLRAHFLKASGALLLDEVKVPRGITKADAKAGAVYDPVTMATRYADIFPEFKENIKINLATYGQFLPEDFFETYVSAHAAGIILKGGNEAKKVVNTFNEMFEDGSTAVQGIIAVTILGIPAAQNGQLLSSLEKLASPELFKAVQSVSHFMSTSMGKRLSKKLENPPAFKPKAVKK